MATNLFPQACLVRLYSYLLLPIIHKTFAFSEYFTEIYLHKKSIMSSIKESMPFSYALYNLVPAFKYYKIVRGNSDVM